MDGDALRLEHASWMLDSHAAGARLGRSSSGRVRVLGRGTATATRVCAALLAMQSDVLATADLSVRLSLCLSVRHVPVFCLEK